MALQGTPGFQYIFLSEPSQSPVVPVLLTRDCIRAKSSFLSLPPQAETEWRSLGSCLGSGPVSTGTGEGGICCFFLLLLMSSIFRGVFFRLILSMDLCLAGVIWQMALARVSQ